MVKIRLGLIYHNKLWLTYFRERVEAFDFHPWGFDGEDKNLRAFRSKEAFVNWYAQEPGPVAHPYRDEAFYTRELTVVSMLVQPKRIVEFGTRFGISTLLLRILNPQAELFTVDNAASATLPNNEVVCIGHLAKMQGVNAKFVYGNSYEFSAKDVDLCFIDADHCNGVSSDQLRAWDNRNKDRGAIVWHDYNERHPAVVHSVHKFCEDTGLELRRLPDSATVWVDWGIHESY